MPKRTLIVVTDFYPPDPTGRAGRVERHVREWLDAHGDAVVIAPQYRGSTSSQPGSQLEVHRIPVPLAGISDRMRPTSSSPRVFRPAARIMASYARWLPPAIRAVVSTVHRRDNCVILTVSNPVSLHLVGLVAKAVTGAPWVAEMRDPWGDDPAVTRTSDRLHRWLARSVLRHADLVITYRTVQGRKRDLSLRYPALRLPNLDLPWFGVDERKADDQPRANPPRLLVYTGQWYPPLITPAHVLRPLAEARKRCDLSDVRVVIVGPWPDSAQQLAADLGLGDVVSAIGSVSPQEAAEWQQKADAGFVVVPAELARRGWLPSKFWDYASKRLPMVMMAPTRSLAARLTRRFGLGSVVDVRSDHDAGTALSIVLQEGFAEPNSGARHSLERLASRDRIERRIADALRGIGSVRPRSSATRGQEPT